MPRSGGGVTAGISQIGGLSQALKGIDKALGSGQLISRGVTSALGSAVTQGIGVATGLQDKFSWVGVAAAGIGNAFGGLAADALGKSGGFLATSFGQDLAHGTASLLANAATRSAIEGSNFGDNIIAALPDAISSVLGRALGGAIAGGNDGYDKAQAKKEEMKASPVGQAGGGDAWQCSGTGHSTRGGG